MQYKNSKNPEVLKLTKEHRERSIDLSRLKPLKLEDGSRLCVWCYENKLGNHPNQKYCCTNCSDMAWAWAYPQKEAGLGFLLLRQNFCCNICQYDYKPFIDEHVIGKFYGTKKDKLDTEYKTKYNWYVVKRLKSALWTKENMHLRPDVDHIVPIFKGGESIGLDNHQAICNSCHKTKSKVDNSGPRRKKTEEEKALAKEKRKYNVINKRQQAFFSETIKVVKDYKAYEKCLEEHFFGALTEDELKLVIRFSEWYNGKALAAKVLAKKTNQEK